MLRGARRDDPPGQRASSPARRRTSTARPASTTCTRSRRSAAWTRSSARTSWSSTTSCARSGYDLWIGDEAWEVDHFLHENPELKTRAVRVADRLRRLPADARGRRARGVPDRRLQRRDDRARRALPAACATARSSSATPTTSSPRRFGPGLPEIRDWTRAPLRLRRLHPGLRPARPADRAALRARARLRRRAAVRRRRSAARASARRCCSASIEALPLRARARAGPAHGRRDRARASTRRRLPRADGRRGRAATCTSSTATSRPATSRVVQGGLTTTMELVAARPAVRRVPLAQPLRAALPRAPPARPLRRARRGSTTRTRAPSASPTLIADAHRQRAVLPARSIRRRRAAAPRPSSPSCSRGTGPPRARGSSAAAPGPSSAGDVALQPAEHDHRLARVLARAREVGGRRGLVGDRDRRWRAARGPCDRCGPASRRAARSPAMPIATSHWPTRQARPNESAITTARAGRAAPRAGARALASGSRGSRTTQPVAARWTASTPALAQTNPWRVRQISTPRRRARSRPSRRGSPARGAGPCRARRQRAWPRRAGLDVGQRADPALGLRDDLVRDDHDVARRPSRRRREQRGEVVAGLDLGQAGDRARA